MKKIIFRISITILIFLLSILIYFSTIGIKTDKFNSKIQSQIKQIEPKINLRLNDVSVKLDLFNFGINLKTIGTDLSYKNKIIKIETINSKISIKSFLKRKFYLTEISISTKSLLIKDLVTFIRLFNNDPKLFLAEKFIKKGYIVADLKFQFDELGNVKKNYRFNGLVKDGKIEFFKNYNLNKIDFIFEIKDNNLKFNDIKITLNNNTTLIPELLALKQNEKYLISGKLITNDTRFTKNEISNFFSKDFLKLDIQKIQFSSENNFEFKITKNLKIKDMDIKSNIDLNNLEFKNFLKLESIFPKIKKNIIFKNQNLNLTYKKDNLKIVGEGGIFLQNQIDQINYEILKKNNELKFKTNLTILKNPFKIDFLRYKKNKNSNLELKLSGKTYIGGKSEFNEISLKEKNKIIHIKNLIFSNDIKIDDLDYINLNYTDSDGLKNNLKLIKKNNDYLISGNSFSIDNLIDELLISKNDKKLKLFNKNFKINFDVKKIYLDNNNTIKNLKGILSLVNNKISELYLDSKFSNNQNIKFTIYDKGKEKVITLYSHKAKPFVDRYKFIKGFEEGDLDFYSLKKNGVTSSTLKIDNFKIQEIPVLAKLLTLASLQGIADLLTGEGIRFTDFEMKFSNKDKLMTIEELYAIGPAISIMLEGYIQSKKLISLRGTLVPATTVNRTISSIPLIGDILVGKKVGEGVFGVSFKIKGQPGNLETSVNPIKTLTPRFITRTLEKIKKN
tara:strand:- start:721 stop:2913 length:2193 start_codon:yes stop_codon:yes gene_type:complete